MSDIKLFRLSSGKATELRGDALDLEKPLQNLIEANLEALLGIRFLATEYSTGRTHGGRIDTLGVDENNCPVILEYKRSVGENVINQGLFYLDWLMDYQAEFKLLVLDKFGKDVADDIDWSAPRLVCIAANFTKYDRVGRRGATQEPHRARLPRQHQRCGADGTLAPLCAGPQSCGYLWAWLKRHALANFCPDTLGELKDTARRKLKSGQKRKSIIMACWKQAELW